MHDIRMSRRPPWIREKEERGPTGDSRSYGRENRPYDGGEYAQIRPRRGPSSKSDEESREKPRREEKIPRRWVVRPDREAVSLVLKVEAGSIFNRELEDIVEDARVEFDYHQGKCIPAHFEVIPVVYLDDSYIQANLCLPDAYLDKEVEIKFSNIRFRKTFLVSEVEFSSFFVKLLDQVIGPYSSLEVACDNIPLLRVQNSIQAAKMETYLEALNNRGYRATAKLKDLTLIRRDKVYDLKAKQALACWSGLSDEDEWLGGILDSVTKLANLEDIESLIRACDFVNHVVTEAEARKPRMKKEAEDEDDPPPAPWATPAKHTMSLRKGISEAAKSRPSTGQAKKEVLRGSRVVRQQVASSEDDGSDNSYPGRSQTTKAPVLTVADVMVHKEDKKKKPKSASTRETKKKENKLEEIIKVCTEFVTSPENPEIDQKAFLLKLREATAGLYPDLSPIAAEELEKKSEVKTENTGKSPPDQSQSSDSKVVSYKAEKNKEMSKVSSGRGGLPEENVDEILTDERYVNEPRGETADSEAEGEEDVVLESGASEHEYTDVSETELQSEVEEDWDEQMRREKEEHKETVRKTLVAKQQTRPQPVRGIAAMKRVLAGRRRH